MLPSQEDALQVRKQPKSGKMRCQGRKNSSHCLWSVVPIPRPWALPEIPTCCRMESEQTELWAPARPLCGREDGGGMELSTKWLETWLDVKWISPRVGEHPFWTPLNGSCLPWSCMHLAWNAAIGDLGDWLCLKAPNTSPVPAFLLSLGEQKGHRLRRGLSQLCLPVY